MATVFWDKDGIILLDFLEGQKTITASYYEKVLRKLKTALGRRKRRGKKKEATKKEGTKKEATRKASSSNFVPS